MLKPEVTAIGIGISESETNEKYIVIDFAKSVIPKNTEDGYLDFEGDEVIEVEDDRAGEIAMQEIEKEAKKDMKEAKMAQPKTQRKKKPKTWMSNIFR